jgi:hypothetical protein
LKGQEVLELKQKELKALMTPEVETSDFEIDTPKTAVKQGPMAVAEASKKQAVSEFKKAEA